MHRLIIYHSFEVAGRPDTELRDTATQRRTKQSLNVCGPISPHVRQAKHVAFGCSGTACITYLLHTEPCL